MTPINISDLFFLHFYLFFVLQISYRFRLGHDFLDPVFDICLETLQGTVFASKLVEGLLGIQPTADGFSVFERFRVDRQFFGVTGERKFVVVGSVQGFVSLCQQTQCRPVRFEELNEVLSPDLRHRLVLTYEAEAEGATVEEITERILLAVEVP